MPQPAGYGHQLSGGEWELAWITVDARSLGEEESHEKLCLKAWEVLEGKGASSQHPELRKVCALGPSSPSGGLQWPGSLGNG